MYVCIYIYMYIYIYIVIMHDCNILAPHVVEPEDVQRLRGLYLVLVLV